MRTGSTLVRVLPNRDGGWDVREPGSARPLTQTSDLGAATAGARAAMVNGGVIQVLNAEGFLVETLTVPAPGGRPRWYLVPLQRVLPILFLVQAVLGLVMNRDGGLGLGLYLLMSLVGATGIVLVVRSHRHDRRLLQSQD